MKIELLWFVGCPSYQPALDLLEQVLFDEKIAATIELVRVNDDADAAAKKFPGSPTLRINGVDPFALPSQTDYAMRCRLYRTANGLKGVPTPKMLRAALRNARATSFAR